MSGVDWINHRARERQRRAEEGRQTPGEARMAAFMAEYNALKAKYGVRLSVSEWASFTTGRGDTYDDPDHDTEDLDSDD